MYRLNLFFVLQEGTVFTCPSRFERVSWERYPGARTPIQSEVLSGQGTETPAVLLPGASEVYFVPTLQTPTTTRVSEYRINTSVVRRAPDGDKLWTRRGLSGVTDLLRDFELVRREHRERGRRGPRRGVSWEGRTKVRPVGPAPRGLKRSVSLCVRPQTKKFPDLLVKDVAHFTLPKSDTSTNSLFSSGVDDRTFSFFHRPVDDLRISFYKVFLGRK